MSAPEALEGTAPVAAAEVYGGRGFTDRHASELAYYFGSGMMALYPHAIDWAHHGQGLKVFGAPAAYEPPDLDRAAKIGTIDRALYRCTDGARVVLALAYGDEGAYWTAAQDGDSGRLWAVAALTPTARARAAAPQTPEFWRAAFPDFGGAPPGGQRERAWVRAFVTARGARNARDEAARTRLRREAAGLLDDAEAQFAAHYDARLAELKACRSAAFRRHIAAPFERPAPARG